MSMLTWAVLASDRRTLVGAGLVERIANPADGRSCFAQLTEKGRASRTAADRAPVIAVRAGVHPGMM
jgi:hypothetical protein